MPRVRVLMSGSSPHTRGARLRPLGARSPGRIIPAYAGSTRHPDRGLRRSADHPRIRGEHFPGRVTFQVEGGSSPHTRGAREPAPQRGARVRIIPAYAGSTSIYQLRQTSKPDHPRIRGEHLVADRDDHRASGSSPHTRGARRPRGRIARICRIIPAYAGSTARSIPSTSRSWDHPRIRGEHVGLDIGDRLEGGSSPHTRGAHSYDPSMGIRTRIIPAYAGSTPGRSGTSYTR